jgi:enterochelin esterase-like enzyme
MTNARLELTMRYVPFHAATALALTLSLSAFAGRVERTSYSSTILGKSVEYIVVLPNAYTAQVAAGKRFPVLYLLHCAGCRAWDWTSPEYGAQVDVLVDSVHYIVVAPDDGNVLSWWLDSPVKQKSGYHNFLVREFKPRIDSLYATLPDRGNTGIAGHSMGGFGAMHNLIESPEVFSAAYSIKGAVDLLPYPNNWGLDAVLGSQSTQMANWLKADVVSNACRLAGKNVAVRFYSGPNDWFGDGNRRLDSALNSCSVPHSQVINSEVHFQVPYGSMRSVMMFFDSVFTGKPAATIRPPAGKGPANQGIRKKMPGKSGSMTCGDSG